MVDLAPGVFAGNTCLYRALEELSEPLGTPALPNAHQRRVIWQGLTTRVLDERPTRQVHLCFAHRATVVNDAEQKAREDQPYCHFGVDIRAAIVSAVELRDLRAQPAQIEYAIDAHENVAVREELVK